VKGEERSVEGEGFRESICLMANCNPFAVSSFPFYGFILAQSKYGPYAVLVKGKTYSAYR
jgi:hypothetical protein